MGALPLVSIVTPSYNQRPYLEQTIRSVLDQTYPHIEYLIMDGGSTDGSVDVIRQFGLRLAYWRTGKDGGQSAAINEGWARASGAIVAWLNSDDFYHPDAVATAVATLASDPSAPFAYGYCDLVDPSGHVVGRLGERFDHRALRRGWQMVPQPSTFIRRTALDSVGVLNERLHYAMDFDLLVRLAASGKPAFVEERLSAFRVHPSAKTTKHRAIARQETLQVALARAHGSERWIIRMLALRARVLHRLPGPIIRAIDSVRGRADW